MTDERPIIPAAPITGWVPARLDAQGQPQLFMRDELGYEALCTLSLAMQFYHRDMLFAQVELSGHIDLYEHGYQAREALITGLTVAPRLDGPVSEADALMRLVSDVGDLPHGAQLLSWNQRCHAVAEALELRALAEQPPL